MDLQNIKYVVGNKEFNKNRLITIDDNVLLNADFLNQQVQKVFGSANISEAFQNMQSLSNHPQTRFNIALYSSDFATSYDKVLSSIKTINDFANHYGIRKENVRFYIIYDYEPDYDYKQVIALSNINSAVNSNFGNQLLFPSNFNTAQKNLYTFAKQNTNIFKNCGF